MLIFVRHGRTAGNAAGLLQGRLDLPLDEVGLTQARQVAEAMGSVDVVISSPLLRARETAAAFAANQHIDERWLELDYGEYDGMKLADVPPETWDKWQADPTFATPGGESMASLDQRVRLACADALELAHDKVVVVVSHVSPIKAAIAWTLGVDIAISFRCHLEQASVCRVVASPGGPVLRSFNEVLYRR